MFANVLLGLVVRFVVGFLLGSFSYDYAVSAQPEMGFGGLGNGIHGLVLGLFSACLYTAMGLCYDLQREFKLLTKFLDSIGPP